MYRPILNLLPTEVGNVFFPKQPRKNSLVDIRLKKEETEAAEQQKACEDRINEIIRSRQDESSKQLEKLQSLENTVKKEIVQEESKLKHKKSTVEDCEARIKDHKEQVAKAEQAYKKAEAKVCVYVWQCGNACRTDRPGKPIEFVDPALFKTCGIDADKPSC